MGTETKYHRRKPIFFQTVSYSKRFVWLQKAEKWQVSQWNSEIEMSVVYLSDRLRNNERNKDKQKRVKEGWFFLYGSLEKCGGWMTHFFFDIIVRKQDRLSHIFSIRRLISISPIFAALFLNEYAKKETKDISLRCFIMLSKKNDLWKISLSAILSCRSKLLSNSKIVRS